MLHASSPFDALASLPCSGQALRALEKTRAFGMTQHNEVGQFGVIAER
jgi:hypothetical protein